MRQILLLTAAAIAAAGCDFDAPQPVGGAPDSPSRAAPSNSAQALASAPEPGSVPRAVIPPPQALTDAAITGRIGSEIHADPAMAGADVSVNTDKGVVVLSGTVKSHEQTGIASAHAQSQDGVLRVDNHLRPALS
jgi:hyperosmotically inducible protein